MLGNRDKRLKEQQTVRLATTCDSGGDWRDARERYGGGCTIGKSGFMLCELFETFRRSGERRSSVSAVDVCLSFTAAEILRM